MKNNLICGWLTALFVQSIFVGYCSGVLVIDAGASDGHLVEGGNRAASISKGHLRTKQPDPSNQILSFFQEQSLVPPILLKREELQAGNPLATYSAMVDLEPQYLKSGTFADFYRQTRFNFEEFMGLPLAGVQAMSLPSLHRGKPSIETRIPESYVAEKALTVIAREARKTRLVIWGEEHHLPQTRSLYEALLRLLWKQGYRYLAAETFDDSVMSANFRYPEFHSGYYTLDPVFGSAVRTARALGYKLIAYETKERGPAGDDSFRDRTQAENIKARIFDHDPQAKVFIIAGRLHASETAPPGGWTPMASVLKKLTGINPFTLYAPTMSQRQTPEEEDPYYRFATSHGLVKEPTIFVDNANGRFLGFEAYCDAYVFWPRIVVKEGRPDWMVKAMGRKPVRIPRQLLRGHGLRLVQVFREGEPASSIPIDQVLIDERGDRKALMLPKGRFWLRTIDRNSRVIAKSTTQPRR